MKVALDQSRIDRLLKLLNEDETAAKLWGRMDGEIYQSVESSAEEFGLSMEGIDPYDNPPWISFFAGQWAERVRNEVKGQIWVYADDRQRPLTVRDVPSEVAWLAQHGRLGDVRRCAACTRFMFSDRKDRRVCSDKCRHKRWEQKPETKERNKMYHRYYHAMNVSPKWRSRDLRPTPTFEQWKKYDKLTPEQWKKILKRRGKK